MTTPSTLPRRSTKIVELASLYDTAAQAYVQSATIVLTVLDPTGAVLLTSTLSLVAGTSGANVLYRGTIPDTVVFAAGIYTVRATVADGSGNKREFNLVKPAVDG